MKPEAKRAAQKRREQVDGKRAVRGQWPLEPGPNICEEAIILDGEASGLTVSGGDGNFFPGLEVQSPFFD